MVTFTSTQSGELLTGQSVNPQGGPVQLSIHGYNSSGSTQLTEANQQWLWKPDMSRQDILTGLPGELIDRDSGLCMDIPNNNTADLTQVQEWPCNGGANQDFKISGVSNGQINIVSQLDGQVLGDNEPNCQAHQGSNVCPAPGLVEGLIQREDEDHGRTEEVPGRDSGAGDEDGR